MGIFDKVRALTLGSVNDLLDSAIDKNNPTVVRQRVRDLEAAIANFSTNKVTNDGYLRTLNRQLIELNSKIATDKVILTHLQASTDPSAPLILRQKAGVVITEQKEVETLTTQIVTQTKTNTDLALTLSRLESQHDQMVAQVHELETIDRDTKAKEQAAHAISYASSALASVNSTSIDNIREKALARNDVASAKFDAAMDGVAVAPESNSEDIDALLASLKN